MQKALKRGFFFFLFCYCSIAGWCQNVDSIMRAPRLRYTPHQLIVPGSLLIAGAGTTLFFKRSIRDYVSGERAEHLADFKTPVDNFLQYAPIPIAYALDFAGVKSKTDIANRTVILIKAEVIMSVTTTVLKYTTKERRPDGSSYTSFPSGHTAQAFTAATFLSEEYKDRFPWMPYVAYSMATATGLLRMANNRHYIGDVLFGAGIGILSTKVSYWTHQYKWKKKRHAVDDVY